MVRPHYNLEAWKLSMKSMRFLNCLKKCHVYWQACTEASQGSADYLITQSLNH
jgi:hypothetical protein